MGSSSFIFSVGQQIQSFIFERRFIMNNINLTVGKLKELLHDLPDDMDIIVPVCPDENDSNIICSFRHVRSAGVLNNDYVSKPALCLAATNDSKDIKTLLDENKLGTWCDRLLY